jgi:hypothetical protein
VGGGALCKTPIGSGSDKVPHLLVSKDF